MLTTEYAVLVTGFYETLVPISWQTKYDPSHYSSCVCAIAAQGIYISHRAGICNILLQSNI